MILIEENHKSIKDVHIDPERKKKKKWTAYMSCCNELEGRRSKGMKFLSASEFQKCCVGM